MATNLKSTGVDSSGDSITASAWVNFNATSWAENATFGTSSVTDVGVGLHYLNFSPTLGSAHYACAHTMQESTDVGHTVSTDRVSRPSRTNQTDSAYYFAGVNPADYGARDAARHTVIVFGEM